MDPLAQRVADRFASRRSYRVDRSKVLRRLRNINDPKVVDDSKKRDGGYIKARFEFVPIRKVEPTKIWNEGRAKRIRKAIEENKALPPIELSSQMSINDGIHRFNVSKEKGFTHVPAIITEWVDTPDEMETPEPTKPKLDVGDWVKMRKPERGRVYGWISEVLHHRYDRGAKRWMYNVSLVKPGDDWPDDIDILDTEFDLEKHPPAWAKKLKDELG